MVRQFKKAGYNNETARRQAATVALAGFNEEGYKPKRRQAAEEGYKPKRVTSTPHSWQ